MQSADEDLDMVEPKHFHTVVRYFLALADGAVRHEMKKRKKDNKN
jgi:hypothetical protein